VVTIVDALRASVTITRALLVGAVKVIPSIEMMGLWFRERDRPIEVRRYGVPLPRGRCCGSNYGLLSET
jgi:phosphosulfolactate phosphohydrolase-like enzyme